MLSLVFTTRRTTVELTWGETDMKNVTENKETPNESRCFALASNDLLCRPSVIEPFYKDESVTLYYGDSKDVLPHIQTPIDLTVTSPPYDNIRTYDGFDFDFEAIARSLYAVTPQGGVVVWNVADQHQNGSETGTSFKQALYFKEIGFNLHDTMIYSKPCFAIPESTRYHQTFEYMFVFSIPSPKNEIRE